jgi:hypothetical protein
MFPYISIPNCALPFGRTMLDNPIKHLLLVVMEMGVMVDVVSEMNDDWK